MAQNMLLIMKDEEKSDVNKIALILAQIKGNI